ncbi:MAG: pantoate--beta-alanine ligase [Deltaproteobacteria bacterium RIFCSPLOWO2_02_FULL_53_8]|nr:MAG: pantoate--beta-alanine ligase [Deltaproteobacteria bacterium RIFCSPLOWO2_02_FULL_53_8]
MRLFKDRIEMHRYTKEMRAMGAIVTLVPTMGYLHAGHRELMSVARKSADISVLSIFVNPIQFGPHEDFKTYPKNIENDLKLAQAAGIDAVYIPDLTQIYPKGFQTYVMVEELSKGLCADARPGHFRGVATIVLKLFNIVAPQKAVFGLKDYQQYLVVRRMVEDLNLDIEVLGVETVRESDGLAMSSRNSYLDPLERKAAKCIPRAFDEVNAAFFNDVHDSAALIATAKKKIEAEPLAMIEYISICDTETLAEIDYVEGAARLLLAVRIGKARLIDNCLLEKKTWVAQLDKL